MLRVAVVAIVSLGFSAVALADEVAARRDFDAGERAYNLGEFDKAIELFKKAYEEWPEPAFLFNLAQTYRQSGDCKQALFFYKRFLALKESDTKKPIRPELKTEVQKRIGELEECMKRELASRPPDALDNGSGSATTTTGQQPQPTDASATKPTTTTKPTSTAAADGSESDEGSDEGEEPTPTGPTGQPKAIVARVLGGAGKLNAGNLDVPVQFFGTLVGGYPLALNDKLRLELGAAFSFTPVPFTTTAGEHGTGNLIGAMANVGAAYLVIPKLAARVEVGVGASIFSGLEKQGNPFTEGGVSATGPLSTVLARAAVSADYAVTPNVVITATPFAFAYTPSPAGFMSSVSSLTTMSFLVGVGYQR